MLESVLIENFQAHETFQLGFDSKICSIVGKSDSGKSSVIRSLRWLFFNKPNGKDFIRYGKDYAKVSLVVDGKTIIRETGRENTYSLDGKEFKAFGTGVPSSISNLLNVTEDAIAKQHDPAYWLTLSPGQVAKELNRVINLELIDKCQANISSELRKAKTVVEVTKDRLAAAKTEVEELSWVRGANKSFQTISERQEATNFKLIRLDKLRQIQGEGQNYEKTIQNAANGKPEALLGKLNNLVDLKKRLSMLQEKNYLISWLRGDLCRKKESLKQAKSDLDEKMVGTCPICGTQM